MLDGSVAGSWYPGSWCAAIDGLGAVRRGFDDGGNQSCYVEMLHFEGLMMVKGMVSWFERCCCLEWRRMPV